MPDTTEVSHALLVRDLAKVYTGFSGGGESFWRALTLLNGVATCIEPEITLRSPAIRYIRDTDPELWNRLRPYVKGWK